MKRVICIFAVSAAMLAGACTKPDISSRGTISLLGPLDGPLTAE